VSLLLLPHHGSDTPWLGPLLDRLAPLDLWVSAGAEPAVARELARRHLALRRTGAPGPAGARSLRFEAPGGGPFPSPGRVRPWQDPLPARRAEGGPPGDPPR
jgi:hypothetical protein